MIIVMLYKISNRVVLMFVTIMQNKQIENKLVLCEQSVSHLGPGARAAGERRKVVQRIEEARKIQVEAFQLPIYKGLCRLGRAFVP